MDAYISTILTVIGVICIVILMASNITIKQELQDIKRMLIISMSNKPVAPPAQPHEPAQKPIDEDRLDPEELKENHFYR